jgi:hypothetical protein
MRRSGKSNLITKFNWSLPEFELAKYDGLPEEAVYAKTVVLVRAFPGASMAGATDEVPDPISKSIVELYRQADQRAVALSVYSYLRGERVRRAPGRNKYSPRKDWKASAEIVDRSIEQVYSDYTRAIRDGAFNFIVVNNMINTRADHNRYAREAAYSGYQVVIAEPAVGIQVVGRSILSMLTDWAARSESIVRGEGNCYVLDRINLMAAFPTMTPVTAKDLADDFSQ